MEQISYTNANGQKIEFTHNPPYILQFIDEMGGPIADIQTQKSPYQDGNTFVDAVLEGKTLTIRVAIVGDSKQGRAHLLNILNPKLGIGVLEYKNGETIKQLECVIEQPPLFPTGQENRGIDFQQCLFTVYAPDPYWRDPLEVSRTLVAFAGTFSFPLRFPLRFGTRGDSEVITNTGDVTTPVKINIQGPVEVPQVINETTGQYIRANVNLFGGDILHIDTSKNHKRVEIYRGNSVINAFGHLDRMSDLWSLAPGDNVIKYSANRGRRDGAVSIAWHNRYLGI
ncbi:phage tail family protein [Salipaludibacillus agaradhaerens]|jgi:hypothetical protein|uniref:Phage tail family protein n=1 Tax=Salipaludibacillus agaradhaerens TaxID=76935 RepID=A0A9Q4B203_SALAG|nr:phage tail family protein [Salipaludibacillus agaradhaerens]MCR6096849.1 phage tail family protein [Salipaludibacillus agaradhaerens]MCR6116693.1 phage tail family protein [Salipaludibacillus agaradhaerens]